MYGRNQCNIVKQLYSNEKKSSMNWTEQLGPGPQNQLESGLLLPLTLALLWKSASVSFPVDQTPLRGRKHSPLKSSWALHHWPLWQTMLLSCHVSLAYLWGHLQLGNRPPTCPRLPTSSIYILLSEDSGWWTAGRAGQTCQVVNMTRSNLQPKRDGNWCMNTLLFYPSGRTILSFVLQEAIVGAHYDATPFIIAFFSISQCDCVWRWGL